MLHRGWFYFCCPIVPERQILPIRIFENCGGEQSSVNGCIDFCLDLLVYGVDVESFKLVVPLLLGLFFYLVERFALYFFLEI